MKVACVVPRALSTWSSKPVGQSQLGSGVSISRSNANGAKGTVPCHHHHFIVAPAPDAVDGIDCHDNYATVYYLNHCCFAIKQVYDNENPWSISSYFITPVLACDKQPSAQLPHVETHVASCVRVPQKGRANCRDPTLNRTSQSWKNKPDT